MKQLINDLYKQQNHAFIRFMGYNTSKMPDTF